MTHEVGMEAGILGPLMFVGALVFLATGYPVAFALGGVAIAFALLGVALGVFDPVFLTALPYRIFGMMANYTLLAIPYFILLGSLLEQSGIAERLLTTVGSWFGRLRGGLGVAVVVVGALLAATTGVVAATVVAMGLISLPVMLRHGYRPELATGVIAASGTLGQIIPPSVVLVVLGDQLGVSVGDLFVGSFAPGLVLTGMYALYVLAVAYVRPQWAPALTDVPPASLQSVLRAVLPPLALVLVVLGSIFWGIATPTEAGAVGCIGAAVLAWAEGKLSWAAVWRACESTVRTTSLVMMILIGSTAFSLVFRGLEGDQWVSNLLLNLPGGRAGFLLVSMAVVFILGFFIDFFEIAFIVVPLLIPAAQQLGTDLVWFGVLLGANLQTSFLTPPFGFALFYLKSVAPPEVTTGHIYRGVIPFIGMQLLLVVLLILFPQLVTLALS
ncbi:MAG: TRAP transporter large permease subunit [Gloeomargarita sp. SKYBB_i_bin120]|nr:TRAP transporter large permease subunit [Gloeomargarita sp. SKYB120]MDW8178693.1 TRAP transporter large permease subunit [Gloeomargarita sp. SKYBB_i_bin120]